MTRQTEGVQVGDAGEGCVERVANSGKIYTARKDCQALKTRLLSIVDDSSMYWETFARFVHGQCSKQTFDDTMQACLKTTEAKILHNELIRSVIYNAHFAMLPPPNMTTPKVECPVQVRRDTASASPSTASASFMTYAASDLRHLPSVNQLSKRISIILSSRKMNIEGKALGIIFTHLKRYVMLLLEGSAELLAVRRPDERGEMRISTIQVMHILQTHGGLSSMVSPAVMAKYSNAVS